MRGAPPEPTDVLVQRLHLRGRQAALQQARQNLAAAWPSAAWPITGGDEVLLLRRLRVQGPADRLGDAAAAGARALAAHAETPWGPGADHAPALRFASRVDYVAWQLHQLLRDTAAPPADAVAALLCQVPLALPTVWQLLRRAAPGRGGAALWRALGAAGAQQVLSTVAAASGWGRSLAQASQAGRAVMAASTTGNPAVSASPAMAEARQVLAGLDPSEARVRLAALLLLWQHAPAWLNSGDAAPLLRQLAVDLVAPVLHQLPVLPGLPGLPVMPETLPPAAMPSTPPAPAAQAWWVDKPPGTAAAAGGDDMAGATGSATGPARHAEAAPAGAEHLQTGPAAAVTQAQASAPRATKLTASPDSTDDPTRTQNFLSNHGGLFFLLQVLGGPQFQRRLLDLNEPQAGWREWLRLVNALGAKPDARWLAFAARAAQLESPAAASALQWPASTATALLQAAHARYGSQALQAATMPRLARVLATPTQVDVHFRLADADLAVRRVGLDSDPGWVPWLGRVLRWHYGSALAPQPHEAFDAGRDADSPG